MRNQKGASLLGPILFVAIICILGVLIATSTREINIKKNETNAFAIVKTVAFQCLTQTTCAAPTEDMGYRFNAIKDAHGFTVKGEPIQSPDWYHKNGETSYSTGSGLYTTDLKQIYAISGSTAAQNDITGVTVILDTAK